MKTDALLSRYEDSLASLPESGGGGCHAALLGVANLGILAGVSVDQIFADLRARVHGSRRVLDREIHDAIRKAAKECQLGMHADGASPRFEPTPRPRTNKQTLAQIINAGRNWGEADIWEASPIRIDWPPEADTSRILEFLYQPDELLFIGERYDTGEVGQTIRFAGQWIEYFKHGGTVPPHVIPNPLTGQEGQTKSGEPSHRADSCVRSHRFAVVEFDGLSREDQIRFWSAIKLPVAALIDSGGKSLHAWVKVDCPGAEAWERDVERRLYMERLIPLGVDSTCRNEARLSRLPGHFRGETNRWQRVLYLAPEGRPVTP